MAAGNFDEAIATFGKVASMSPRSPQPYVRLADAYSALKNPVAARESLQRALQIAPRHVGVQRALVILDLANRHPEQALAVARSVQIERPQEFIGFLLAGDVEAFRENWSAAALAYREGLKRGGPTELASKLHTVLVKAGKREEAESFEAQWMGQHPRDAGFQAYLGERSLAQGDLTGAEKRYRTVVELQPENAIALNNLAWITSRLKKPGASAFAERAHALHPDEPAYMDTLATTLAEENQLPRALELERKAIALAPTYQPYRLTLAKLFLKMGDKAAAKTELTQLAKLGDKFAGHAEVSELLKAL
jgi:putative PEP-CTERM system TPR-repeat lipoprotein